jgi:hypothetical protein
MLEEILNIARQAFAGMALTSDDIFTIIFSLLVSTLVGVVISQVYRITHRGVNYELSFMTSLVLLAPIVALVMLFIRGNLVVSLGLVGSLSIIRFRTPIKDTRDMVYLFWVIAVGLGSGTFNWGMVSIASLFILLVIFILYLLKYGRSQNQDYVLVITGKSRIAKMEIKEIINNYTNDAKIRTQNISKEDWEIIYELRFPNSIEITDDMLDALNNIEKITNVSLLAPQLALPA